MRRNVKKAHSAKQKRKALQGEATKNGTAEGTQEAAEQTTQEIIEQTTQETTEHTTQETEHTTQETIEQTTQETTSHTAPRSFWRRFSDNVAFMKYVTFLIFLPPILNMSLLRQEASSFYSKVGQKVDMGYGQKMYIHCQGRGLPTVILDAPTGSNSDIWIFVQKELAKITKVCVYDRSGIGNSDAPFGEATRDRDFQLNKRFVSAPSTVNQMVNDLYHLVNKAYPLPHPFILVGSETASLVARMYGILHHEDLSDVVLIDPLVENLLSEYEDFTDYWYTKLLPSYEALHLSAAVGLSRIAFMLGLLHPTFFEDDIPEEALNRQKILLCNPWHINAAFYEYLNMNASFRQMNDLMSMNSIPPSVTVNIVRRENPEEMPPELLDSWQKSHNHLINYLHPASVTYVIPKNGFYELYSTGSALIEALREIIVAAKNEFNGVPTYSL